MYPNFKKLLKLNPKEGMKDIIVDAAELYTDTYRCIYSNKWMWESLEKAEEA